MTQSTEQAMPFKQLSGQLSKPRCSTPHLTEPPAHPPALPPARPLAAGFCWVVDSQPPAINSAANPHRPPHSQTARSCRAQVNTRAANTRSPDRGSRGGGRERPPLPAASLCLPPAAAPAGERPCPPSAPTPPPPPRAHRQRPGAGLPPPPPPPPIRRSRRRLGNEAAAATTGARRGGTAQIPRRPAGHGRRSPAAPRGRAGGGREPAPAQARTCPPPAAGPPIPCPIVPAAAPRSSPSSFPPPPGREARPLTCLGGAAGPGPGPRSGYGGGGGGGCSPSPFPLPAGRGPCARPPAPRRVSAPGHGGVTAPPSRAGGGARGGGARRRWGRGCGGGEGWRAQRAPVPAAPVRFGPVRSGSVGSCPAALGPGPGERCGGRAAPRGDVAAGLTLASARVGPPVPPSVRAMGCRGGAPPLPQGCHHLLVPVGMRSTSASAPLTERAGGKQKLEPPT